MSVTFLLAADERAIDCALTRPLPTDDAVAALELHGPILELGAGEGVWGALLRTRGLTTCMCYDPAPSRSAMTEVLQGDHTIICRHASDHTLLLVRGGAHDELAALQSYANAGGGMVAHVGSLDVAASGSSGFAAELTGGFERHVSVVLPGGNDQLTFWSRKQPAASSAYGVLDVRLELVDLEGPDWAAPPDPKAAQRGPFTPEIGSSLDDVIAQGLSSLKGTEFDDGSF